MKTQRGAATLLLVMSLLALISLALLYTSRHVLVEHFNAQAQHKYHQALGYAEEGMRISGKALETDGSRPASTAPQRYTLSYQEEGEQLRVTSHGHFDGYRVAVQQRFALVGDPTPPPPPSESVLQIHHDLNLSGAINIIGGKDAKLKVDGDVTLNGTVKGIDTLLATGNITIGGNQTVNVLGANGNITLRNGNYQRVSAMGNLQTRDSATIVRAQTNGTANIGSTRVDTLIAIGNVSVTNGGSSLGEIETQGSFSSKTSRPISSLKAERNLEIEGWGGPLNATIGGEASYNRNNTDIKVRIEPGLQVPITSLTPITLQKHQVDANDYQQQAHYLFRRLSDGKIQVQVRAIHGIDDGLYLLGRNQNNHENYLCQKTDSNGRCTTPSVGRLCRGYSDYNTCLTVSKTGVWTLAGNSLAPGLVWFDGDLQAGNGRYYNSFIASGNIKTMDNHQVYAVNYIAYPGVCSNNDYPGQYPTDYCNTQSQQFNSHASGNIAYLAGSYQDSQYKGGDIMLGSSSTVHGNVIAGNTLNSGGRTVIKGYVTVANQGASGDNNWGASTTIDLTNLPDSFKPGESGSGQPPVTPPPVAGEKVYRVVQGSWIDHAE
ncbi:hypothetical protein EGI20_07435 [Aquitalea sp. S1-19]|nr:hypothetical protein [Aquitalea sp. S1-19]